jgi:hypothetical protein
MESERIMRFLGGPHGIFADGDGRIHATDNTRIVRINDMSGAGWTTLGTVGNGTNQFDLPDSIFVDAAGRVYIADTGNSRLIRLTHM